MKKIVVYLFLITVVNFSAFSRTIDDEGWLSYGFQFGSLADCYNEQGHTVNRFIGSPGFCTNGYRFFDKKNHGIFVHGFVGIPITGFTDVNGVTKSYDFGFLPHQVGFIIGPGFRHNITEDFAIKWGIGIDFMMSFIDYNDYLPDYGNVFYETSSYNFGIGGDFGIKGNITKTFFMSIGSIFQFDFLQVMSVKTSFGKNSGIAKDFLMLGISPYITFGFNLYRTWQTQ